MLGFEQVGTLFLLIIVGFFVKKMKIVSQNINKEISQLVINITLPAFILSNMNFSFSQEILMNSMKFIVLSFGVYFFVIIGSFIYVKVFNIQGKQRDVIQYIVTFSNTGFMGYPIIQSVFGAEGVFYTAIYNLSFSALVWTYGVYIIKRSTHHSDNNDSFKDKLKAVINPSLVAVIVGFAMFMYSISFPTMIQNVIDMVGRTTTPLSMMFIGFILSEIKKEEMQLNIAIISSIIVRLVVIPTTVYLILKTIGFSGYLLSIPVIITAMPAAANTAIISAKYDSDYKLASKLIFVTTLFSVVTIPLFIGLVN